MNRKISLVLLGIMTISMTAIFVNELLRNNSENILEEKETNNYE